MKKLLTFLLSLVATVALAQSSGINGGGPNGGGGASPGGSTNSVQYNTGGSLGGVLLSSDQVLQGTAGAPQAASVPNCGSATQALSYSTTTHAFGCQTVSGSSGSSGTFTATLNGGCTTSPTGTMSYSIIGNLATVSYSGAGITCTSNAASTSFSGLPVAIQPATSRIIPCYNMEDNGTLSFAAVCSVVGTNVQIYAVVASGTLATYGNNWTASGTKGIGPGFTFTYPLSN